MNESSKKFNKRMLIWLLPAAVAVCIFCFSAQSADESSQLSDGLLYSIVSALSDLFGLNASAEMIEMFSGLIRKAAHVTEYIVLCASLNIAFYVSADRNYKTWLSLLIVFLYACTDEIHQLFVPGRSGQFTDVLIDCSGAAVLSLIIFVFVKKKKKI